MKANFPPVPPDVLALAYRTQIRFAGFTRGSLPALAEFTECLVLTLGEEFVCDVDPAYASGKTSFWLRFSLVEGAMDMPITRHLLLSMHLFGTADQFLRAVRELLPAAGSATERKKSEQAISGVNTTRDDYRKRIRHEIKLDPRATMEKLWKKAYRPTAWLFENDKSWLSAALVQKIPTLESNALTQSDEDQRKDQHFATLVETFARKLIASKEKPQRVTLGRLVACLPIKLHTLRRHEARYPILSEQLERCKESSWSFSARRVLWAKADWPCSHLPQELCADRGEMLGLAAEGIVSGLGIDLAIAPPYRPDWKAVVESRFRLLNQLTQIHWTPGGVAERIKERGDRDYRLDATLDLKQFTKIMIASVLHYNQHRKQPDLLNQDMIATGIDATPLAIWNWGIEHGFGTPNEQVEELVRLHLMAKSAGTVQAGGIFFAGMFYVAEDSSDDSRYSRARAKGREVIDVWHDSTNPQFIWIRAADKSLKRCVLRASEVRYRDHRLEEILDMLQMIKSTSAGQRHAMLTDKVRLDEYIQTTISGAVAEKKEAGKPDSKAAQLASIRHHRAIERLTERVAATPVVAPMAPTPAGSNAARFVSESFGARGAEVIDILSQLKKKTKHE